MLGKEGQHTHLERANEREREREMVAAMLGADEPILQQLLIDSPLLVVVPGSCGVDDCPSSY